jgi:hypothetical protein
MFDEDSTEGGNQIYQKIRGRKAIKEILVEKEHPPLKLLIN